MSTSPDVTVHQWEIFVTTPDGSREEVDTLGTFGTFGAAAGAAALLQRLLDGDDRSPDVLMWVHFGRKKRDAVTLLKMGRAFYRRGIDPRRVAVEVERYGSVAHCPVTNDEDTVIEPRTDAGHVEMAGPHTTLVLAERR